MSYTTERATITIKLDPMALRPVSQKTWDDWCKANRLRLAPNGRFYRYLGRTEASCDRLTVTFAAVWNDGAMKATVALALKFWVRFGGRVSADDEMQEIIDGTLFRTPAGDGQIKFDHPDYSSRLKTWIAWSPDVPEGFFRLGSLVGKTVNIGSKDGCVFHDATVNSFEDGILTIGGGTFGYVLRDIEGRPLTHTIQLRTYDIARGYVHAPVSVTA